MLNRDDVERIIEVAMRDLVIEARPSGLEKESIRVSLSYHGREISHTWVRITESKYE